MFSRYSGCSDLVLVAAVNVWCLFYYIFVVVIPTAVVVVVVAVIFVSH